METRDGREIQMSRPARVSRAWGGGRSGKTKQPRASHLLPTCRLQPSIPLPSIPLNIAGELINRTLPRLGQGYLDALVRSCAREWLKGAGLVRFQDVLGGWEPW